MKTKTAEKVLSVVRTVIVSIIVAVAVFMMVFTIVSVTMFDENERNIFGYKFYIVQSDSMKSVLKEDGTSEPGYFDVYDVIVSKEVTDFTSLEEGDIITFVCGDPKDEAYSKTITHMIRYKASEGEYPSFKTFGTTKNNNDSFTVESSWILGEYQFTVPFAGPLFRFLKQPIGYVVCILIPFLLLILSQGINFVRLFRQYKKEQMAEMEAERARIEEERQAAQRELAEAQKMMSELMAMKEMLAKQAAEQSAPTVAPEVVANEPAEPVETESAEAEPTETVEAEPAETIEAEPTETVEAEPTETVEAEPVADVAENSENV